MAKCDLHKMAEIEKRLCHSLYAILSQGNYIRWQHLNLFICTLLSCIKKIIQSLGYVGLLGHALPSTEQIVGMDHSAISAFRNPILITRLQITLSSLSLMCHFYLQHLPSLKCFHPWVLTVYYHC